MANQLKFFLFNCDNTYNLEVVEKFLLDLEEKHGLKFSIDRLTFGLPLMAELCEKTLPKLAMDVAVFVLHADESRLSINEDNAGIGYARLYRALLQKTDNRVLIVIGGDRYYQNEDEKARSVISRWVKRKVASQFGEEYLDGRQSFIFSWNEKHRLIHEEAMRHYLDPEKRGSKFEYTPPKPQLPKPTEPKVPQPLPKPIPPLDPRPASADTDLSRESSLVESDKENLIQDNKEDTVTHRRCFRDRDQPKTIGPGELTPPATYQGGDIILLEAKVRYGKISYEDEDVLQRERGWRPSLKLEADVETDLKSYPVRTVTFYQTGDGSITYKYDKLKPSPTTSDWGIWRFMVACCEILAQCCGILAQCLRDIWGWCRGR